jgi:hypothetical protein
MVHLRMLTFSVRKNQCMLANVVLPPYLLPPVLAGLWHLGHIAGEGQRYGSPKNGLSETNH